MPETHHVYLLPGFFGFTHFGDFKYFAHVREHLEQCFRAAGADVRVHYAQTSPTSSLRRRAARVLHTIAETAGEGTSPIHLVGHSTGGLDARLLVAPGVDLQTHLPVEALVQRVRTVVTVSTPHFGTPVASFFMSFLGQKLLRMLSLGTIYVLRFGRLPLRVLTRLAGMLVWTGNRIELQAGVLDQLYNQLLHDFTEERRAILSAFFAEVMADQSLLPQLSPEGIDLINARATLRADVRYGSVVTAAPPPGLSSLLAAGLGAYAQGSHALYRALYRVAAGMPPQQAPTLTTLQADMLRRGFGQIPLASANDGIVPALSQVWGEVIHAAWADHLDVIGHFDDPTHDPPHIDWLITSAQFDRGRFERLWGDVARYLLAAR